MDDRGPTSTLDLSTLGQPHPDDREHLAAEVKSERTPVPAVLPPGAGRREAEPGCLSRPVVAPATGLALSVAISAAIAALGRALPFDALNPIPSEVTSRTHPSPFDLGVALAGGAAGARPRLECRGQRP